MKKSLIYSILAALLLAVVAFFFFYPDVTMDRVLQQHDIQQGIANGQEGKVYYEQTGETTRWTDALFGGMPTFQINPTYPANSCLGWFTKLYTLWLPSPANLLFGLMLGFFIMCLCMKMRWHTALFGALAWGLSTYFIIIIGAGHIWKFLTLMYIPPTIGGVVLCYRGRYVAGTALASLFGALQLMSNHIQMSYYFLIVVFFMILAWLWKAVREHKTGRWGIATACVMCAAIFAIAANAPSLYNTYVYSKETTRGKPTEIVKQGETPREGLDLDYITMWSYGKGETFSLLSPNVKGGATVKPVAGESKILPLSQTDKAQDLYASGRLSPEEFAFLDQFPQYFGDQPMTNGPVYVGAFVLLLAILAMFVVKGPMKWALLAVSILAIFLSWGKNMMWFTEAFVNWLPGYGRFRTVSSILVIVEFTTPLLAAMCLKRLCTDKEFWSRNKWTFITVMGGGALVCLIGWLAPSVFGSPFSASEQEALSQQGLLSNPAYHNIISAIKEIRLDMVAHDFARSFGFILLGSAVMVLYFMKVYTRPAVMATGVACVALLDLFSVNKRYIDSDNFTEEADSEVTFSMTDADRAILKDNSNYRVMDLKGFNEARSSYFHKTIGGYHAAKLTRYQDLIDYQIARSEGPNLEVLNMLNAKYFLMDNEYEVNPDANGNAWFVEHIDYVETPAAEMKALDTLPTKVSAVADRKFSKTLGQAEAVNPGDTIYETSYAPNKLTYKSKSANGGVAVFSEVFFPWGWQATVDGKPVDIGRVDYVLRAIKVPAGTHDITFRFDPQSAKTTDAVAYCGIIVIYLCCAGAIAIAVLAFRRNRKKEQKQETKQGKL